MIDPKNIYTAEITQNEPQPNKCCGALWLKFDFKNNNIICGRCAIVLSSVEAPPQST